MIEWHPHDYQKRAVQFMVQNGSGALWLDPGLGKTAISLQAIKILKNAGAIGRTLVVCPLRPAYSVWPEEVKKWVNFENITVSVLHGKDKDSRLLDDAHVHVVNFEGLNWLSHTTRRLGMAWPYDLLIVDEISYLKNTRTQRFKTLSPLLDKFKRRFGLTGSPAPNSLMDIFGPQLVIDRGATFGKYITHFRTDYFLPTGYGGYEWVLQPGAEDRIYAALADKVLRMKAEDYLSLPELVYNKVFVDLPDAARKVYDQMERALLAQLAVGDVSASNAAVSVMKCQQIANGGIYVDGTEKEIVQLHDAKTSAVEELVEELSGNPVMIAFHYAHDLARLKKAFPHAPVIGSGVVGDELSRIINDWNAGLVPVLLAHPQSAGHGLNLQGSGHAVIWYSLTWSLELYEQFIRRLWRQGQRNNIVVHHIIANDTVDLAIMAAVERKDKTQKALMNAIQDYAKRTAE